MKLLSIILCVSASLPHATWSDSRSARNASVSTITRGNCVHVAVGTQLTFNKKVLRTVRPKEEFVVLDVRDALLFVSVVPAAAKEIAASIPLAAAKPLQLTPTDIANRVESSLTKGAHAAAVALISGIEPEKKNLVSAAQDFAKADTAYNQAKLELQAAQAEQKRTEKHAAATLRLNGTAFVRAAETSLRRMKEKVSVAENAVEEAENTRSELLLAIREGLDPGGAAKLQTGKPLSKAAQTARYKQLWTEKFVENLSFAEPDLKETVSFIAGKLRIDGRIWEIGYSPRIKQVIARQSLEGGRHPAPVMIIAFPPEKMNPQIKFYSKSDRFSGESGIVKLATLSGHPDISVSTPLGGYENNEIELIVSDRIDAEKVAKAFSHLFLMLGAKEEAF